MKPYLLIIPLFLIASCKKDTGTLTSDNSNIASVKTKIIGLWDGAREIVHYTDSNGEPQTFDDNSFNSMLFSGTGVFAKYHGGGHEFTGTFTVTSTNAFTCTSSDATPVIMSYKIITLNSTTLSVTSSTMPTWSGKKDGITYTGTNAWYEETYTKTR